MAGQQHVVRTREAWEQLIAEQRGSGESQDAFCTARGLCKSTLQAWKRRLRGGQGTAVRVAREPRPTPGVLFTPLLRSGTDRVSAGTSTAGWTVELELGGGLCLRLRQGT